MKIYVNFPPFTNYKIEIFSLDRPVVSCAEAAFTKGIPLHNELKTLILKTSKGLSILHIPGDRNANLRLVKKAIGVDEAYLADKEIIKGLQVQPGTVTPILKQIWELPQILSFEILSCEYISTNAGSLDKYIVFNPMILMDHPNIIYGNFTK